MLLLFVTITIIIYLFLPQPLSTNEPTAPPRSTHARTHARIHTHFHLRSTIHAPRFLGNRCMLNYSSYSSYPSRTPWPLCSALSPSALSDPGSWLRDIVAPTQHATPSRRRPFRPSAVPDPGACPATRAQTSKPSKPYSVYGMHASHRWQPTI